MADTNIFVPQPVKNVDPTAPKTPAQKGVRTFYQAVIGVVLTYLYGLWSLPGVSEYTTNFVRDQGLGLVATLAAGVGIPAGLVAYLQNRAGK